MYLVQAKDDDPPEYRRVAGAVFGGEDMARGDQAPAAQPFAPTRDADDPGEFMTLSGPTAADLATGDLLLLLVGREAAATSQAAHILETPGRQGLWARHCFACFCLFVSFIYAWTLANG